MHYFSQSHSYDHPWSRVVIGMWHKYPNPHCSHVMSVDVIDRSVDPRTGVIRTERILGCKQKTPIWVVKLFGGSEDAFVREVSFVDPTTQETTMTSVNLSLSQFATCYEQVRYVPLGLNRTSFTQTAEIQSRMGIWRSAADKLEHWLVQRFEQNAQLGKLAFTDVLRSLWDSQETQPVRS
ncbi:hypothetical protein JAAARDRAFT_37976 [Jaapia argillacea MUCL 33604]|uniref:PRELI/MSF1 domain-containing protein n=1 Tax=Jaapia argillacea MUCL 33604 TaxID=933084 RepID=A0A067PIX6_9AGAM|nr:hypothetical protein JAAARDRAFT_37976 [Jaapia argillacea MUCL 33604]